MVFKAIEEFVRVDENTAKVSQLVGEITAASDEQAQGIEQISSAVAAMDHVVQQNAAHAEESAAAAQTLHTQAERIQQTLTGLEAVFGRPKAETGGLADHRGNIQPTVGWLGRSAAGALPMPDDGAAAEHRHIA